jgi:CMP-N,N'-diacetyllegionaminic acid synthase
MKALFLITARGGSKGIPGKNIKKLAGKPLILYSLEYARMFAEDCDICISTDSREILEVVEKEGYKAPFIRPESLSLDNSGSYEVIVHAVEFYRNRGINYDVVVLLQPTSPLRLKNHLEEAMLLYEDSIDMVVSVSESYFYHYYEEKDGLLVPFGKEYKRRQDAPLLYKHNGSIYIINISSLFRYSEFGEFRNARKYLMPAKYSIDIDTLDDWGKAEELILKQKKFEF